MNNTPRIAVVGSGYWGKNLVRNFYELGALRWICDTRDQILREAHDQYGVRTTTLLDEVLTDPSTDAIVIAAPAAQHFEITRKSLQQNKDVYVEKPLSLTVADGQELVNTARAHNRILMVGHILEYHPALLEIKRLISSGELGRVQYIYSSRLNLGKLRTEENILWSFAPHDISAILFLLDETPVRIASQGGKYLSEEKVDTTLTTMEFSSGVKAHIFVSWLHPFKEQKLTIVGSRKMVVFDDVESERKLVVYPHHIEWIDRVPVAMKEEGQIIAIPKTEPLRSECQHFLESIGNRCKPRTSGESGVRVLSVLEACERSMAAGGQPLDCLQQTRNFSAHSTAVIDAGAIVGEGTRIWHFSHIMSGATVGRNCNLGQNVVISPEVVIGNNVKIQNNVSVYTGVELEDDVFCGPSMVFTNIVSPRSHVVRKHEYQRTLVHKGASIGANATVVCGISLGKYCLIGAGAVVAHDVPDYALMVGVPAHQIGWVCNCGIRLADGEKPVCTSCGRQYSVQNGRCEEVVERFSVTATSETPRTDSIAA
jgi:UDP-2-acetamido-3-amino-2,3-dideoxy-glucuronate N-acetyltransferase